MLVFEKYGMKIWIILFISLVSSGKVSAQCCSPGNPVGGTANLSIVPKQVLRMNTYFRYGYADTYFEGSSKSDFLFVENASYNFLGTILTYGLLDKLNVEVELGYYFNLTQNYDINATKYTLEGFGLRDGVISLKYNFYKNAPKELEFTAGLGTRIPFRKNPQTVNNVELPIDVQSSNMAYGIVAQTFLYKGFIANGLHLFLLNRYENTFENTQEYRYGQALYTSLFVSKALTTHWSLIIQVRDEWREPDQRFDQSVPSSGGNTLFVAPQLNYNVLQQWNISVLADIPVFRYYEGIQLSPKYAFSIQLSREFDFLKKINSANDVF
jgi:hypothetical protein